MTSEPMRRVNLTGVLAVVGAGMLATGLVLFAGVPIALIVLGGIALALAVASAVFEEIAESRGKG